jgi:heptosyltransferase-2
MAKLKNSLAFFICILYFFIRGRANKSKNIKKVLIVQMGKLGDMVCVTPMFRAIKEKYPEAKIFVMGNAVNKELLADNSDVDEYIEYRRNIWDLIKHIRQEKFDFACVTSPNFMGLVILYLGGISMITAPRVLNGFSPYQTASYRFIRNLVVSVSHRMGFYAPKEYLKLLEPIGITSQNTKKHLGISHNELNKIDEIFSKNNIGLDDLKIIIAPSVGNKIKIWPADRFATIADVLIEKFGAKVITIGGASDKDVLNQMLRAAKLGDRIVNLQGLTIGELKALVSKADMLIAADSGPIYIAEAFDVATVDIIGPIDENEQPPIGAIHKIVLPKNRKNPELHVMNARIYNGNEARRLVESITPEMVIKKVEELI